MDVNTFDLKNEDVNNVLLVSQNKPGFIQDAVNYCKAFVLALNNFSKGFNKNNEVSLNTFFIQKTATFLNNNLNDVSFNTEVNSISNDDIFFQYDLVFVKNNTLNWDKLWWSDDDDDFNNDLLFEKFINALKKNNISLKDNNSSKIIQLLNCMDNKIIIQKSRAFPNTYPNRSIS